MPSTKNDKAARAAATKKRKAIMCKLYNLAVKNNETANWAASYGRKNFTINIEKHEIQYWAMKNEKPYLDELVNGVRTKIQ